jgi:hypothetical protein
MLTNKVIPVAEVRMRNGELFGFISEKSMKVNGLEIGQPLFSKVHSGWNSVENGLPPPWRPNAVVSSRVFVTYLDGEVRHFGAATIDLKTGESWTSNHTVKVTHWMEIPIVTAESEIQNRPEEQPEPLPDTTAEDHAAGRNLNWCIGCSPENCSGCGGPNQNQKTKEEK